MRYIDFHVHMDFYSNMNEIVNTYEKSKIYSLFVTNLPEIYAKHILSFKNHKYVKLALGYHPEMSHFYDFNKNIFDLQFNSTNYIGEIGIDGSKKNIMMLNKQIMAFEYICKKIGDLPKILSIHSRKSEETILEILIKNKIKFAVFHWYTGSIKILDEIISSGYYFSINYSMLQSKKGKEILSSIPLDRILFETDGPFTKFNSKIISPQYFESIYNEFNDFYNISNFSDIVFNNFKTLIIERQIYEEKNKIIEKFTG